MIAAGLAISFHHRLGDDPMITFRYSKNLANGFGFVFNPGEKVLSTTSPLTGVLFSIPVKLGMAPQQVSIVVAAVCLAASAYLVCREFARIGWRVAAWASLIGIPLSLILVRSLVNELPMYLLAAVATLLLVSRRRYLWALPLAAITVLIRPDGIVLFAVAVTAAALVARREPEFRRPLAIGTAIGVGTLVVVALIGRAYYGRTLPVTLAAKRAQHDAGLGITYPVMIGRTLRAHLDGWWNWPNVALAVAGVAVLVLGWRRLTATFIPLLLIWVLLFGLAFSVSGTTAYGWYAAPVVLGYWVLVALGAQGVALRLARVHASSQLRLATAAVLLVVIGASGAVTVHDERNAAPLRTEMYRPAADWLRTNTPADASVGTAEVGIIGYYADRRIIDFAGLIQPDVPINFDREFGFEGFATYAFRTYQPDYVALITGWSPSLTSLPEFVDSCTIATVITVPGVGGSLDIYRCVYADATG